MNKKRKGRERKEEREKETDHGQMSESRKILVQYVETKSPIKQLQHIEDLVGWFMGMGKGRSEFLKCSEKTMTRGVFTCTWQVQCEHLQPLMAS